MIIHRLPALCSSALHRRPRFLLQTGATLLAASLGVASLSAGLPENLGPGVRELAAGYDKAATAAGTATLTHAQFNTLVADYPLARTDTKDRVLVNVYLNGSRPLDHVIKDAKELGCLVTARVDWYRNGVFSAYLPVTQAATLARTPGVNTVLMDFKPKCRVGKVTSQGTTVLKSMTVNQEGYYGAGITVGALSDSFNTAMNGSTQETTATTDEADDDLPGPGSAYNTNPVYVLEDYGNTAATAGTDEGRAMCQIIHDVAPASNIAFATANVSEVGFAQNILALATPTTQTVSIPADTNSIPASATGTATVNGGGCQVICDDVGYFDEPMFSDGVVAQAIDQATNNYGASYFSAAGNDGGSGYEATYVPVANTTANQTILTNEGIAYSLIPATEQAAIESFHSFGTNAANQPILLQRVRQTTENGSTIGAQLIFQWDDPFNATTASGSNAVTTDFDILVFKANKQTGAITYSATLSGTSNNFQTNVPYEIPQTATGTDMSSGTQYYFVIVRTNRTPGTGVTQNQATHIRWVLESDASGIDADFVTVASPESFGHNCASTCNGMAAFVYDNGFNYKDSPYVPEIEAFSSNGPSMIYFDSAGNRLSTPISRKQPTLAATDGIDTSFFGGSATNSTTGDSDGDGFPNFFGTSATGPHAAGCAALLLNVGAQNGISLAPADIRELLTSTTQGTTTGGGTQDQDPDQANASGGPVKLNASDRGTYTDANAYTISFSGPTGTTLTKLVFDLSSIKDDFFTAAYPVTAGTTNTGTITTAPTIATSTLSNDISGSTTTGATETLTFKNFNPGDTLSFGVAVGTAAGNIRAGDNLAGATFTATVTTTASGATSTYTGTIANVFGKKWNYKSGYGLIDVNAAVNRLLGH